MVTLDQVAPVVVGVEIPDRLSYSDYRHSSDCLLKSWPRSFIKFSCPTLRTLHPRHLIVGRFFHEVIEYVGEISHLAEPEGLHRLSERYLELIREYSVKYAADLEASGEDLLYWGELTDALDTARAVFRAAACETGTVLREEKFVHSDLRIFGIVDELVVRPDALLITDYKSRYVIDTDLDTHFYDQLVYYALLLSDKFEQTPLGRVVGFGGAEEHFIIDETDMSNLQASIARLFRRFTGFSKGDQQEELAKPDINVCGACRWRLYCPSLRESSLESFGSCGEVAVFTVHEVSGASQLVEITAGSITPGYYYFEPFGGQRVNFSANTQYVADKLERDGEVVRPTADSTLARASNGQP